MLHSCLRFTKEDSLLTLLKRNFDYNSLRKSIFTGKTSKNIEQGFPKNFNPQYRIRKVQYKERRPHSYCHVCFDKGETD